jgi:hypothetical protein
MEGQEKQLKIQSEFNNQKAVLFGEMFHEGVKRTHQKKMKSHITYKSRK